MMLSLQPLISTAIATSPNVIADHCPDKCGSVTVPYPFGINFTSWINNDPTCSLNRFFMFTCNTNVDPPRLFFGDNMPIHNISVEEGTISVRVDAAFNCYNKTGLESNFSQSINLGNGPFRFSSSRNKLTTIGCDTMALIADDGATFAGGCISICTSNITLEDSCSGLGCCQTPIPKDLRTLNIEVASFNNHSEVLKFNPCEYGFLADERTFNVSDLQLSDQPISSKTGQYVQSEVVIEWAAIEETCKTAQSSPYQNRYACGNNANCTDSDNGIGYRCICKEGFRGNPYLPQGCQDIDECQEPKEYKCDGTCKNTVGSYTCQCPLGMHGDGKVGCQGLHITTIAAIIGSILLVVIIIVLIVIIYKRRRKEKNFLGNGGMLLKNQRVRIFSEAELGKATKNFDASGLIGEGGFGYVYKGILADNTEIAVKKPKGIDKAQMKEEYQHEICIVSQVNHKNVVKILGLCLETEVPLLVYEFISNGTLFHHIHHNRSQLLANWKSRLRIAAETALALDYLHSLADPPIIHGDIKSSNILLDDTCTVKVSDFGASVLISTGECDDIGAKIKGTFGYLDPEYLMTGNLTAKSDVYSFGVVLVELLTGEKPNSSKRSGERSNIIQYFLSSMENHSLSQVVGFSVSGESEMEEIEMFAEITKECLRSSGARRPDMKQVAEELVRLRKLNENSWNHDDKIGEETQHLLGQSSYSSIDFGTTDMNQEILSLRTFDIEYSTNSI